MATPRPEQPEKRLRKKQKPPKKSRVTYSLILLLTMLIVGFVAGFVAYNFGKQALEGVNQSPTGAKLPKANPTVKPTETPKAKPANQDGKTSFLLDESEIIAEIRIKSQEELGKLTRPAFVAKADVSDRKNTYIKIDRTYNSIRDPLAISATSDQQISAKIAALRQRVYTTTRVSNSDYNRFAVTNNTETAILQRRDYQQQTPSTGYR
jgi:hypothetical protein